MKDDLLSQANLLKVLICDEKNERMHTGVYEAEFAIEHARSFLLYLELDFERMYKYAKENFYEPSVLTSLQVGAFQQVFYDFLEGSVEGFMAAEKINVFDEDYEGLKLALGNIHILGYDQIFTYEYARSPEDFVERVVDYLVGLYAKSEKYICRDDFEGFNVDGVEVPYDDMPKCVKAKFFDFNESFYK